MTEKALSKKCSFTLQSLKLSGFEAVFLGMGKKSRYLVYYLENLRLVYFVGVPQAKLEPMFANLTVENGFYTSKDFLPAVSKASKPGKFLFRVFQSFQKTS